MRTASKVLYIITTVFSAIGFAALLLVSIIYMATTTDTIMKALSESGQTVSQADAQAALTVLRVTFIIFTVVYLLILVFSVIARKKLKDDEYYHSGKIGFPIASIIIGLVDWPLLVAGILWLVGSKQK
jgi:uncharacterized ion transporter superfamily protein YfcC